MIHYDDEDNPSSLGLLPVMGDSTPGAGRDGSVDRESLKLQEGCSGSRRATGAASPAISL